MNTAPNSRKLIVIGLILFCLAIGYRLSKSGNKGGKQNHIISVGSTVVFEYKVTESGTGWLITDTKNSRMPKIFVIGKGQIFPAVEAALIGRTIGPVEKISFSASTIAEGPLQDVLINFFKVQKTAILDVEGTILDVQN